MNECQCNTTFHKVHSAVNEYINAVYFTFMSLLYCALLYYITLAYNCKKSFCYQIRSQTHF